MPICSGGNNSHPISHISNLQASLDSLFVEANSLIDSLVIPSGEIDPISITDTYTNPADVVWHGRVYLPVRLWPGTASITALFKVRANSVVTETHTFRIWNLSGQEAVFEKASGYNGNGTFWVQIGAMDGGGDAFTVSDLLANTGNDFESFVFQHKSTDPSTILGVSDIMFYVYQ